MNRADTAAAVARALALIGTPRTLCPTCGTPTDAKVYGGDVHTVRSAAMAVGLDPQVVYRAVKQRSAA